MLEASQDRQPRLSWPWWDRSARVSKDEGQRAYFLMTGEAAEAHRTREGSDEISRFDSERGGEEVGLPVSGLELGSSWMSGAVSAADRLAALDWTMVLKNRTTVQQEARAEVQLPPGAVVSGVSLWVNGEERQAVFWGAKEVRQAYQSVVAARRDPLLVTWRGADRVMAQCFPVPASGEMKIKLSITAPLDESGQVRIPQFTERNFGIAKSMPVSIDVDGAVEAGPKMLRAGMAAGRLVRDPADLRRASEG